MAPWLLVACFAGPTPSPSASGAPATATAGSVATPIANAVGSKGPDQRTNLTRLYNDTCAKCHGGEAQGGGGGTPTLLTQEKFDQKLDKPFFDAIKNGVPNMGMEAYGATLSDEEIWGLVVHIRELQAKGLRDKFGGPRQEGGVYSSKYHRYRLEEVIPDRSGLSTPWGIDWLPDGRALLTNRPGFIHVITRDGKLGPRVEGLPPNIEFGQGGMMDVAVHPNYAQNGWIYLAVTDPAPGSGRSGFTKIVRGKLTWRGDVPSWGSQQTIWQTTPDNYNGSGVHFGCRIVFDGKGKIFFSVGERGNQDRAQDLSKPNGKIYRVNEDGSIPGDNPFANDPNAIKSIWSYGHRNPQGLVMDLSGNLWDTEHGPRGGDELNLVEKGKNYGWPIIAFSINYNDSPHRTPWPAPGQNLTLPTYRWLPSIGASGLDVGKGGVFPQWRGDLFAGGLSGANVDRIRVRNGQMVEREEIVLWQGRVRDVATAPDGSIWVVLNGPDKVIKVVPAR